jgi:predicted permease
VAPVVLSLILRLFIKDELLYGTMVILAAVPVGNLPLMRVEEVGGDSTVLSQGIILSTIMAIVTIPIITLFM